VNPPGFEKGYYVEPTLFADVTSDMTIFREEIFGPVLCISSFKDTEDGIQMANDTEFGLTAYLFAPEKSEGIAVASRLQAGMVHVNGAPLNASAPFGGYKKSGNGRERGKWGIEEYLETKAVFS
jgi:aldehyde dehydrogenase (NAD+)